MISIRTIFSIILFFCTLPTQAQKIDIGLHDDINRIYISANQKYQIVEDRSTEQGIFEDGFLLLERKANQRTLLRSSPEAAMDLLIASAPDMVTTSSMIQLKCIDPELKRIRISKFDSKQVFNGDNSGTVVEELAKKKTKPCLFKVRTSLYDTNTYNIFRGEIVINPSKKTFTVINRLDLEDYLRSVVASEMPTQWHSEALKSQAVAARTYTLSHMARRKNLGYDLKPTVEDQMYLGYKKENPRTSEAVKKTDGEFLVDKSGLFVNAYYSSHAGLASSNPENTWGLAPKHYLQAVEELTSKPKQWTKTYSHAFLAQKLSDLKLAQIKAITVLNKSPDGRALNVLVSGNKKWGQKKPNHIYLTGEEFRHHLGLMSTNFDIEYLTGSIKISGQGYGHGIGLSQYGAKFLAEKGKNYQEILGHYYKGSLLVRN